MEYKHTSEGHCAEFSYLVWLQIRLEDGLQYLQLKVVFFKYLTIYPKLKISFKRIRGTLCDENNPSSLGV